MNPNKKPHHKGGQPVNNKKTWVVRIIKTKEVLDYFRSNLTANNEKPRWEKIVKQKCEIIKNEEL